MEKVQNFLVRSGAETSLDPEHNGSAAIAPLVDAPRSYILDTGSARHLTCRKNLTHSARSRIYEASVPIHLAIANGTLLANQMADYFAPCLAQTVQTYALQNTPDVLGAGLLCEEGDFAFYWPNWRQRSSPHLINVLTDMVTPIN